MEEGEERVRAALVRRGHARWVRQLPHTHVYLRADNGALITKLRAACDFIRDALARGVDVALVSKEEGEAGAGFVAASFLILEHLDAGKRRSKR